NSALARDTAWSLRTGCRNLQCRGRWIVAVNKSDGLPVLRQESAVRNVDDLQLVGIVVQLQRHGINVLSAREHYIHREGCAFCLGKGGRVKEECSASASLVVWLRIGNRWLRRRLWSYRRRRRRLHWGLLRT